MRRNRFGSLRLALCVALGVLMAGAADASRKDRICQIVIDSPCTLSGIVEQALTEVPGTVLNAGVDIEREPSGDRITVFFVEILDSTGEVQVLLYDGTTCGAIVPTPPTLSLLEAMDAAVAAVAAENGGLADPLVLQAKFKEDTLRPAYLFKILDSRGKLLAVRVDGLSGDVDIRDAHKKKKKKRKKRGNLRCNDGDSDGDSDSDSDGDDDSDSD